MFIFRFALLALLPVNCWASEAGTKLPIDLTQHWIGYASMAVFFIAYVLAMMEESTMLRKSKPMVFAASLIWVLIASHYVSHGLEEESGRAFRATLEGYAKLFLFILVSMTYLNAMEQRGVFDNLRIWLLSKGFGYRKLFWITGIQSFFLSSMFNNLTTALLMGAVVMAMAKDNRRFITIACVNIVVATNAGGSFSPFGDITTLLVWQKGVVPFAHFFSLLLPSLVNFLVPAAIMHFWVPKEFPKSAGEPRPLQHGALGIIVMFLLTIVTSVCFENFLGLPPAAGMLAGLTYLSFYFFYLYKVRVGDHHRFKGLVKETKDAMARQAVVSPFQVVETKEHFDVFHSVAHLEWDTLLYFYGVMVGVGGLSFIGYLTLASKYLYTDLNPTFANILVGIVSAFIDNGTIMYAVLTMAPKISEGQWLLVTLTAGVGGSLLAIGSAAGVGLLGQTKGAYSFVSHLKWTPVIALGFAASIFTHFLINGRFF
ncbi:MAG: sodium:proton antiporter NhaD [Candidatus Methylumidiphilus sp.]